MSRLVAVTPFERGQALAYLEGHLAEGGQLIDLPGYLIHAAGGGCPASKLDRFRSWLTANAATAASALKESVDTARIVDRLNSIRVSLAATLAAQAALAERRALEHASRKLQARFARGKAPPGHGEPPAFNGFPDARAVAAAGGVAALLNGAWTSVEATMNRAVETAARDKAGALRGLLPEPRIEALMEQYRRRGLEAVAVIIAALNTRAEGLIDGQTKGLMPMAPVIRSTSGFIEGARPSTDITLDRTVPIIPPDVQAAITASPEQRLTWLWVHGFYGTPLQPFDPHVEIDHNDYTTADLESLVWFPGDHHGCTCEALPQFGPE